MKNCEICTDLNRRIEAASNFEVKREIACLLVEHQFNACGFENFVTSPKWCIVATYYKKFVLTIWNTNISKSKIKGEILAKLNVS